MAKYKAVNYARGRSIPVHFAKQILPGTFEYTLNHLRGMFAIDGCKPPSSASKEWSGTRADFEKKAPKLEQAMAPIITTHREHDRTQTDKNGAPGKSSM